jgi:FkbM family methyltransferase
MLAGPWVYVDPRDVEITPHLVQDGFWEAWLTLPVLWRLRPGMACVDVGANCGYYTMLMADLVGPEGHVLAVEPNEDLVRLVERGAEANDYRHVQAVRAAAGAASGDAVLVIRHAGSSGRYSGSASLHFDLTLPADVQHVPVRPLDELLVDWPRVDFVKIDVEEAERDVWRGMRRTVERHRDRLAVMLEVGEGREYDIEDFCTELTEHCPLQAVGTDGALQEVTPRELAETVQPGAVCTVWLER